MTNSELISTERRTPGKSTPGMAWLFAGVAAGALLAAAVGWDLFPESSRGIPTPQEQARELAAEREATAELRSRLAELEADLELLRRESSHVARARNQMERENDRLRHRLAGEANETSPVRDVGALLELLEQGRWSDLDRAVSALLTSGEGGFPILLDALQTVVHEQPGLLRQPGAAVSISRAVVQHETSIVALIEYALHSSEFRKDPRFAERILLWASRFFGSFHSSGGATSAQSSLVQILEKRLETGETPVWIVVKCFESLGMAPPTEALARKLKDPRAASSRGVILTCLAASERPESIAVVQRFVSREEKLAPVEVELALDELARNSAPPAREALEELLEAPSDVVATAAHAAYFSLGLSAQAGVDRLIAFLNSRDDPHARRHVLHRARVGSPRVFRSLAENPQRIEDPALREELQAAVVALETESQ